VASNFSLWTINVLVLLFDEGGGGKEGRRKVRSNEHNSDPRKLKHKGHPP